MLLAALVRRRPMDPFAILSTAAASLQSRDSNSPQSAISSNVVFGFSVSMIQLKAAFGRPDAATTSERRAIFHASNCGVNGRGSSLMESVSRTLTAGARAGRAGRPGSDSLSSSFSCRLFFLLALIFSDAIHLSLSESELHEDAEEDESLEDGCIGPGSGSLFLFFCGLPWSNMTKLVRPVGESTFRARGGHSPVVLGTSSGSSRCCSKGPGRTGGIIMRLRRSLASIFSFGMRGRGGVSRSMRLLTTGTSLGV